METEPSRQRTWQKAMVSRGLCSIDGVKPLYRDERCTYHYLKKYMRKRGFRTTPENWLRAVADQLRVERIHWRKYWAANKHLLPGG